MNTCQFHPTAMLGVTCGNPATRQIYFPDGKNSYYMYICEECLPVAITYWDDNGFKVEF